MKKVPQTVTLIATTPNAIHVIATATSKCYNQPIPKSKEDKVAFVMRNASRHRTLLEHAVATIDVTTDRGISHEIVRHRIASYSQESTRYCNYHNLKQGGEIAIIMPYDQVLNDESNQLGADFLVKMQALEAAYMAETANEVVKAQHARDGLPTCLRTSMTITMNFRQWLYFLHMRLDKQAHPKMRHLAYMIWKALVEACPELFTLLILDDYHSLLPLMQQYEPELVAGIPPHPTHKCPICGGPMLKRYNSDLGCLSATCLHYGTFLAEQAVTALNTTKAMLEQRNRALYEELQTLKSHVSNAGLTLQDILDMRKPVPPEA